MTIVDFPYKGTHAHQTIACKSVQAMRAIINQLPSGADANRMRIYLAQHQCATSWVFAKVEQLQNEAATPNFNREAEQRHVRRQAFCNALMEALWSERISLSFEIATVASAYSIVARPDTRDLHLVPRTTDDEIDISAFFSGEMP